MKRTTYIALGAVLTGSAIWFYTTTSKKEIPTEQVSTLTTTKETFEAQCTKIGNPGCCKTSATNAPEGSYLIEKYLDGCKSGYTPNTLKCPDSLTWCEPVKN